MPTEFDGFPAEAITFLRDLRENNNKAWFDANKTTYVDAVREPARAFVAALGTRLQEEFPNVTFDTRTNGSGSLMRINRDVRFSKDKSPYKTNIAMMFWEGDGKKTEKPGFGLQFNADGFGLMAGQFGFSKAMLTAYREAVAGDDLGPALLEAVDQVTSTGDYTINGAHYKRVPRGYDADHPRADWLKYNALWASMPENTDSAIITSPAFIDVCMQHFTNMAPIQQWLVQVDQRLPTP